MFDHDRSAARGKMSARKLIIFEHESKFGNAHASELFELVKIHKKPSEDPPRSFDDYTIEIPRLEEIPIGVKLIEKL
jgi:CRISPR-associated protein Csd2